MLYVYSKNMLNGFVLINDVEAGFTQLKYNNELFEDDVSLFIMKYIDSVSFKKGDYIETPFGSTSMDNLSSGCKALLLAYYYRNKKDVLVNILECGENAIELLFELAKTMDISVYTTHTLTIYDDNAECIIDGKKVISGIEIYGKLGGLNVEFEN